MRVLLVADDKSIVESLRENLARYGIVADRRAAGAAPGAPPYDVVVLDLDQPGLGGVEFCRRLCRADDVPLVLLTARGEEADRALGLALGADGRVAKPYSVHELVDRLRTAGRRVRAAPAADPAPADPAPADPVRRYGPLAIDTRSRQIRLYGVPVTLAPKEYDLLVLLASEPGAVVDRRHILETVWEPDFFGPGKTLDFHVASLRRKLGGAGWIENRRGVGFRLVVPA